MRVGRRSEAVSAKAEALGVKLHKEPCGLDIFRFPALEKHYRLLYHVKTVANECNIQGHPQKNVIFKVTRKKNVISKLQRLKVATFFS